jgi:hypothetical protein
VTCRVYRYQVPVDDRAHTLTLTGPIRHVAARQPDIVEVWAEHFENAPATARTLQAYGTGHPIPAGATWIGTALAPHGLVWHLYAHL